MTILRTTVTVIAVLFLFSIHEGVAQLPPGRAQAENALEGFEPYYAFDGNLKTSWKAETGQTPVSLSYAFTETRPISEIETVFPPGRAFLYRIEVSQNAFPDRREEGNWVTVVDRSIGKGTVKHRFKTLDARIIKTTIWNRIPNNSFEQGEIPSGWLLADGTLTKEPSQVHTGQRAVSATSGYLVMVIPLDLELEERTTLTFSFYGMSPDKETGYLILMVETKDGTSTQIEKPLGMFRPEYTFHRSSIFLPSNVTYIDRAHFYRFAQRGSIFYDDVFLMEGWTPADIPEIQEQLFK